jgi:hypothetical protein
MPAGWIVESRITFSGATPDVIVAHPVNGLVVAKVVVLPVDGSAEVVLSQIEGGGDARERDPRDELLFWTKQIRDIMGLLDRERSLLRSILILIGGCERPADADIFAGWPWNKKDGGESEFHWISTVPNGSWKQQDLVDAVHALVPLHDVPHRPLRHESWERVRSEILGTVEQVEGLAPQSPVVFTRDQVRVLEHLNSPGLKRVKGAAGAGKTLVAARVVAECIRTGGRALVIVRNKTMVNLVRSRILHFLNEGVSNADERVANVRRLNERALVTWQERWWHYVCSMTGMDRKRRLIYSGDGTVEMKERRVIALVRSAVEGLTRTQNSDLTYDLVVIDEAQNILPECWEVARQVVGDDGRAVVIADPTQSMYGKRTWTDQTMRGFQGNPWRKLTRSHRIPVDFASLVKAYLLAHPVVDSDETIVPEVDPQPNLFPTRCFRIGVQRDNRDVSTFNAIVFALSTLGYLPHQVAFLVPTNDEGWKIVRRLTKLNRSVAHAFNPDQRPGFGGTSGIRGATYQSFAGWESPCLVLDLGFTSGQLPRANDLLYSGITRLAHHASGATLIVVEANNKYRDFVMRHFDPIDA